MALVIFSGEGAPIDDDLFVIDVNQVVVEVDRRKKEPGHHQHQPKRTIFLSSSMRIESSSATRIRTARRGLPTMVLSLVLLLFLFGGSVVVESFVLQSNNNRVSSRLFGDSKDSSSSSLLLPPPIQTKKSQKAQRQKQRSRPSRRRQQRNTATSSLSTEQQVHVALPTEIPSLSSLWKARKAKARKKSEENNRKSTRSSPAVTKSPRKRDDAQHQKLKKTKRQSAPTRSSSSPAVVTKEQIPWQADYTTSVQSQGKIKQSRYNGRSALQTLLSLRPTACNGANICCALVMSAQQPQSRTLLYRVLAIVQELVVLQLQSTATHTYFTYRQLSNIVWALAKHYDRDPELSLTPADQELNTMHGDLAQQQSLLLDTTIDRLAQALQDALKSHHSIKKEELCMTLWAYGILRRRQRPPGWQQGPVVGTVVRSSSLLEFAENKEWKQTTTSTEGQDSTPSTTTTCPTGALLQAVGQAFLERDDDDDNEKNLSYPRIQQCQWRELANIVWAFASHGGESTTTTIRVAQAVAHEVTMRLQSGQAHNNYLSRDIAQIIWSLGILQADEYRIADSLVEVVHAFALSLSYDNMSSLFRAWSCADIVQVALSLAHARLDETDLMVALYTQAHERSLVVPVAGGTSSSRYRYDDASRRKSFFAWELSILLWAQARLYLTDEQHPIIPQFMERAVTQLANALESGETFASLGVGLQEQANMAWSLAVLLPEGETLSHSSRDLLRAIFKEASASCHEQGVIQLEHAHQLWQAFCLLENSGDDDEWINVPEWFRKYLQEQWIEEKARPKTSSARHRSLSKILDLMGVAHYNEHDEDIDVAIVLRPDASWTHQTERSEVKEGVKVAVEFDGPNHFTRPRLIKSRAAADPSATPRALGHTVLKYRLLKQQGWSVVRVPYFEFDKIPFWASMERQRYVQRLLKTHGNLRFSHVDVSVYKPVVPNRRSRFD